MLFLAVEESTDHRFGTFPILSYFHILCRKSKNVNWCSTDTGCESWKQVVLKSDTVAPIIIFDMGRQIAECQKVVLCWISIRNWYLYWYPTKMERGKKVRLVPPYLLSVFWMVITLLHAVMHMGKSIRWGDEKWTEGLTGILMRK